MGIVLDERRLATERRVDKLKARLGDAEQLCHQKACVYATGSFARGEAHSSSDLDLFIVGSIDPSDASQRLLKRLDEISIKADLIKATRAEAIPDFSGDGKYLEHYTSQALTNTLGRPENDVNNTFTARLLLLLESRPLLETGVYKSVIEDVIKAYWLDYAGHENEFIPAFLANDILRLWRTFCVNYEVRTKRAPELEKAKRKIKNYKLKYSRLLTCYSALLYLLAIHNRKNTVSREDAMRMVLLTPTQRLECLLSESGLHAAHEGISLLIASYEEFLGNTDLPENSLVDLFLDPENSRRYFLSASAFGDQVFEVLELIGQRTRLHRLLVV